MIRGMTQMTIPLNQLAVCQDCHQHSEDMHLVSTVIGKAVTVVPSCPACLRGFAERGSAVLRAPIEDHGHGYLEVFVDDTHYVKTSPTFGPVLAVSIS